MAKRNSRASTLQWMKRNDGTRLYALPADPPEPTEWELKLAKMGIGEKEAIERIHQPEMVELRNWCLIQRFRVFLPELLLEALSARFEL